MKNVGIEKYLNKTIIVVVMIIFIILGLVVYKIEDSRYTLELIGDSEITIALNSLYQEKGYIAYDKNGNVVTNKVKVTGNVDITKEGTYKIKYQIGMKKVYRTVIVKHDVNSDIKLTLIGNETDYVMINNQYTPLNVTAIDLIDGNISSRVTLNNNVDTSRVGEYEIVYSVINSRGGFASIKRKVIVYDLEYQFNEQLIDNRYLVTINFSNQYYQKALLPNGTTTTLKEISYIFTENGDYVITAYDKFGNTKNINIKVTQIDIIKPTGSCVVNLYDNKSTIVVTATDDQKIKGYIYEYGAKKSDLITTDSHVYYEDVNSAKVTVYDMADNNITINCETKDLSTKYSRSYTSESNGYGYKLYIPSTLTKRNKLPLVVFLHGTGECGSSLGRVNANSFPKYINEGANYNFVMIAPQIPDSNCKSAYFVPSKIKTIIDGVVSKYPIDPERIIITGFSLGGINTYKMLKTYPGFFAGAIPVAGDSTYDDSLLKTNIWAFHGSRDGTYAIDKALMDKVIKGNPNSRFTSYDKGHNITDLVYKDQNVINWILNAHR